MMPARSVADYFAGWRMHRGSAAELSSDVVWHGCTEDVARLVESALANCGCAYGGGGLGRVHLCGAHQLLLDQHALDHLAFARSVRQRLLDEEWRPATGETGRWDVRDWSAKPSRAERRAQAARGHGRLVMSLLALLFILALGGPGYLDTPVGPQIASWQTR